MHIIIISIFNCWTPTESATVIYTVLTAVIGGLAYIQLRESNKLRNADFYLKIKQDLFTKEMYEIFNLFSDSDITYNAIGNSNFKIQDNKIEPSDYKYLRRNKDFITTTEFVSNVLDHLEDLAIMNNDNLINEKYIDEGFEYYISFFWEHKACRDFIVETRKNEKAAYQNLEQLYNILQLHPSKGKRIINELKIILNIIRK